MPIVRAADAVVHDMHGSRFCSYAAPALGSHELCAWRLEIPPGSKGVPHTVTREEVLFVLAGTLDVSLSAPPADGRATTEEGVASGKKAPGVAGASGAATKDGLPEAATVAGPGDAIVVPAGSTLRLDNPGGEPVSAWVTTSIGLEAVLADGTRITPPWTR